MEIPEPAAHVAELPTVQANLTILTAGIVDIQDPLGMTLSALAFGATLGVKSLAMNERAAEDIAEVGDLGEQAVEFGTQPYLCHLYR
jgi:hypothetical protein